jgi:hypothetical protein
MRSALYLAGAGILAAATSMTAGGADWDVAFAQTQPSTSTAPATATAPATTTAPATKTATTTAATKPATKPVIQNAVREFSQPEWTIKTFAEAIKFNDADSLEACFNPAAADDEVTLAGMKVVFDALRLRRAAVEKFGEDAASQFEVTTMTISLETARLAALGGRVRKLGTGAVFRISDEITLQLSQDSVTGNWKIDPATFVPLKFETKTHKNRQLLLMNATLQGIEETIADLKDPKTTNVTAAASAYRVRMSTLIKKAKAAATQPASQPATTKSAEK